MGLAYVLLGGYWEQKFDTQFDGCNSQPEFVIYIPFTKCKNNVEKQLKSVLVDALISPLFESLSSKVVVVAKFSGITEAELHIHFAQKVVSETAQAEFVNNADLTDEKEQIFVFESINQPSNYLGKLAFQQRGQIWEI